MQFLNKNAYKNMHFSLFADSLLNISRLFKNKTREIFRLPQQNTCFVTKILQILQKYFHKPKILFTFAPLKIIWYQ